MISAVSWLSLVGTAPRNEAWKAELGLQDGRNLRAWTMKKKKKMKGYREANMLIAEVASQDMVGKRME